MSSAKQNQSIAKLIIGAMSIDGLLDKSEQTKVAATLKDMGMPELIADVGAAIENDDGSFDFFEECRELKAALGSNAASLAPKMFEIIADVITHDRFVSVQEATYLASIAKRLELKIENAQKIFAALMAKNRCRLELAGQEIDEIINPSLKELLSFEGAEDLVGVAPEDSLEELLHQAESDLTAETSISNEDIEAALEVLGLRNTASPDEAEEVWKETIETLDLPKMANMGVTYVAAAIERISKINSAYQTIYEFHEFFKNRDKTERAKEDLEKRIKLGEEPSTRDELAGDLEDTMTGVGTVVAEPDSDS